MNVSRTGPRLAAAGIVILAAAGCGPGGDPPTSGQTTPSTTTLAAPAAGDCSASDVTVPTSSTIEGVEVSASTDATGTSLLLKNTGSLTVVVIPDPPLATRLEEAPYTNPTDEASRAVLDAVASIFMPNAVPGMPAGIPLNQVYVVPPKWAVCGLTGRLDQAAGVRYLRDKASSAEYFVTKYLADAVVSHVTPAALKQSRALVTCAQNTFQLLSQNPELQGLDLYSQVISGASACRYTYRALLSDEAAVARTESKTLQLLEKSPTLLRNTKFFLALVHG